MAVVKRKNKTSSKPAATAAPDTETLSPEWEAEYLAGVRLAQARIPEKFQGKSFETFKTGRRVKLKAVLRNSTDYVYSFKRKESNGLVMRRSAGSGKTYQREDQPGLIMRGPVGCGKTHLAVAMLKALISEGFTGLYYNMPDLLTIIRSTYDNHNDLTERDLLEEVNQPDLLVLDDVGSEAFSDWVQNMIYLIINRRYESCKPILITTNLSESELEERLGKRTYSRLCEMCLPFEEFPKEDYRKNIMR